MEQELITKSSATGLLIERQADVRHAMQQLEATESKALFVVDDGNVLYGSLTDGDVRRWILGGGQLNGKVEDVCNREPVVATALTDREEVKRIMLTGGIASIPVIDDSRQVTGVLRWKEVFGEEESPEPARKKMHLPVVIMAGGFGTPAATGEAT